MNEMNEKIKNLEKENKDLKENIIKNKMDNNKNEQNLSNKKNEVENQKENEATLQKNNEEMLVSLEKIKTEELNRNEKNDTHNNQKEEILSKEKNNNKDKKTEANNNPNSFENEKPNNVNEMKNNEKKEQINNDTNYQDMVTPGGEETPKGEGEGADKNIENITDNNLNPNSEEKENNSDKTNIEKLNERKEKINNDINYQDILTPGGEETPKGDGEGEEKKEGEGEGKGEGVGADNKKENISVNNLNPKTEEKEINSKKTSIEKINEITNKNIESEDKPNEEDDIPVLNINDTLKDENTQSKNIDNPKNENNENNKLNKIICEIDKINENTVKEFRIEYKDYKELDKFTNEKILAKLIECGGDQHETLTELMLATSQIVEEDKK